MAFADGITIDLPQISIDGIEFNTTGRSAMLDAEDDQVDKSNYGDPKGTRPGATDWTFTVELELTYGDAQISAGTTVDAGTWNTLHAMRKTRVEVICSPSEAAASSANPTATFDAYIPTLPFMKSEVAAGEVQRFELVLSPIGEPVIVQA